MLRRPRRHQELLRDVRRRLPAADRERLLQLNAVVARLVLHGRLRPVDRRGRRRQVGPVVVEEQADQRALRT